MVLNQWLQEAAQQGWGREDEELSTVSEDTKSLQNCRATKQDKFNYRNRINSLSFRMPKSKNRPVIDRCTIDPIYDKARRMSNTLHPNRLMAVNLPGRKNSIGKLARDASILEKVVRKQANETSNTLKTENLVYVRRKSWVKRAPEHLNNKDDSHVCCENKNGYCDKKECSMSELYCKAEICILCRQCQVSCECKLDIDTQCVKKSHDYESIDDDHFEKKKSSMKKSSSKLKIGNYLEQKRKVVRVGKSYKRERPMKSPFRKKCNQINNNKIKKSCSELSSGYSSRSSSSISSSNSSSTHSNMLTKYQTDISNHNNLNHNTHKVLNTCHENINCTSITDNQNENLKRNSTNLDSSCNSLEHHHYEEIGYNPQLDNPRDVDSKSLSSRNVSNDCNKASTFQNTDNLTQRSCDRQQVSFILIKRSSFIHITMHTISFFNASLFAYNVYFLYCMLLL